MAVHVTVTAIGDIAKTITYGYSVYAPFIERLQRVDMLRLHLIVPHAMCLKNRTPVACSNYSNKNMVQYQQ